MAEGGEEAEALLEEDPGGPLVGLREHPGRSGMKGQPCEPHWNREQSDGSGHHHTHYFPICFQTRH